MKPLTLLAAVSIVALIGVATVAVWASIADAPWEDSSNAEQVVATPTPRAKPTAAKPNFTQSDVLGLAQRQVGENGRFPTGTEWVRCTQASFRSGNNTWVVTCNFYVERDDLVPEQTRKYTFNDRTGKLTP